MLRILGGFVFFGIIVLAINNNCFAQTPEREQGPYIPKVVKPSAETTVAEELKETPSKESTGSLKSPVRLKKIEEKMQQLDAIKQNKAVENQAIEHFQAGESLYKEGKKKEANSEWMQAIELSKDPDWMKRTINEAKRKGASDLKAKKLADKQEKKKKAAEAKQKKKLDRLRKKEEKRRQKLITFNQKPAKFFALHKKQQRTFRDLSKPPKTGAHIQ